MKLKKSLMFFVAGLLAFGIAGCNTKKDSSPSSSSATNEYTISFVNYDKTVLQSGKVKEGELPVYNGETPTRPSVQEYSYEFTGWDKEIVPAVADATYTAKFWHVKNSYQITFKNYDGSVLQSTSVEYGTMPVYTGANPTKPDEGNYEFVFTGWTPELVEVTEAATYTATFSQQLKTYTVTFMSDGQVYTTANVQHGNTVSKPTNDPTKAADAEYVYFFLGWQLNGADFDFATPITEPITLEAAWEPVSATDHGTRCHYIHYERVEPTYAKPGVEEFWYCELHNSFVLVEPTQGTIEDSDSPYVGVIETTDERYIAPLTGGNLYMSIQVGIPNNDSAILRSLESRDTVLSVTFKYRLRNATKASWFGFATTTSLNPGAYADSEGTVDWQIKTESEVAIDGRWHETTIEMTAGADGYIAFVSASNSYAPGTQDIQENEFSKDAILDIDDVYLECGSGEELIDFNSDSFFETMIPLAEINGEEKINDFARIDVGGLTADYSLLISKRSYTNITSIQFKYRLVGSVNPQHHSTGIGGWARVMITTNGTNPDPYPDGKVDQAEFAGNNSPTYDGEWHTVKKDLSGTGHVAFGTECGDVFSDGTFFDFDKIVITYDDGKTATETFDSGRLLDFKTVTVTDPYYLPQTLRFSIDSEPYGDDEIIPGVAKYARLNLGAYKAGNSLLYTPMQLSGVTRVTFRARFHGGIDHGSAWMGIGVAGDHSVYSGMHTSPYDFDDEWDEYAFNISETNGYVNFIHAIGEFSAESYVDIDDIVITYDGGKTLTEDFTNEFVFAYNEEYVAFKRS